MGSVGLPIPRQRSLLSSRFSTSIHNQQLTSFSPTAYWIAFGPHGPRAEDPPGEGWQVFRIVVTAIVASLVIFGALRMMAKPPPHTMTKEWQEASNEQLKVRRSRVPRIVSWKSPLIPPQSQKSDPVTGISSEGYSGKGQVQSPPGKH